MYNMFDETVRLSLYQMCPGFFFSLLFLIALSPFLFLIMSLIRIDSDGDPIFTQERVGKNGKIFHIYKFRTMVKDASQIGPALTQPNDFRITRLGRWLRRTSIDEIPQLFNILKGEMSFMGPRPEIPSIVETYTARQKGVLQVRPGLSGWAQVNGRDALSIKEKLELDLEYVSKVSFWFDIRIFFMTFPALISNRGVN